MKRMIFAAWLVAFVCLTDPVAADSPWLACGVKIVEVTPESAVFWTRLTRNEQAHFSRLPERAVPPLPASDPSAAMPVDIVPGIDGWARLTLADEEGRLVWQSEWRKSDETGDHVIRFQPTGLGADQRYRWSIETGHDRVGTHTVRGRGAFRTAPASTQRRPVTFLVTTCQAIRSIDDQSAGHRTYDAMRGVQPDFLVHTGDIVYYDKFPFARTASQARAKWHTLFAFTANRSFFLEIPAYFLKDDHDTLRNDCWPGQKYGELEFEQGQQIFREQTGLVGKPYRTFRWGRDLQIWLTENRDFRSPNNAPDGPAKTILGEAQKAWLRETLSASDATFKFVISPGPIVGPDKRGKADNHSNAAFATEGKELRNLLAGMDQTYVICGDRHWQYSSRDPSTGLLEFGCGPINDQHDFGGDPGNDPAWHRYFGSRGGFLKVTVDGERAEVTWQVRSDPAARPNASPPFVAAYRETLPLETRAD